jgi:hypothetical protein
VGGTSLLRWARPPRASSLNDASTSRVLELAPSPASASPSTCPSSNTAEYNDAIFRRGRRRSVSWWHAGLVTRLMCAVMPRRASFKNRPALALSPLSRSHFLLLLYFHIIILSYGVLVGRLGAPLSALLIFLSLELLRLRPSRPCPSLAPLSFQRFLLSLYILLICLLVDAVIRRAWCR